MTNLVLIGMSGCGKTTVGRALAEALGVVFVDMDKEIERRQGRTIVQIFDEIGEQGFRDLETAELLRLLNSKNFVLATGGGVVTLPRNIPVLKKLGKVVFLNRSVEAIEATIETSTRPMLHTSGDALRRLYAERLPLYRACADVEVDADDDVQAVVTKITLFNREIRETRKKV